MRGSTLHEPKVVISAAVEPELRAELERRAVEGGHTLSQEVRRIVAATLRSDERERPRP